MDRAQFRSAVEAGRFLEWAEVAGEWYGTPLLDPPTGCDVLLEIDVQGARQVLEREPTALCILLEPPSVEEQERRLRARGDSDEQVRRRVELGREEVAAARELADAVVVNDDLAATVERVAAIIDEARRGNRARRHAAARATRDRGGANG